MSMRRSTTHCLRRSGVALLAAARGLYVVPPAAAAVLIGLTGLTLPGRTSATATPRARVAAGNLSARHRRALLVAVNGYYRDSPDPEDVWSTLHTLPDVTAIKAELIRRFEYTADDIKILSTPAETTHASIVEWFKKWLIDDTVPGRGDEIYFHYSGHGGEVPNDNTLTGDLDPFQEPDGYDRTLIPSDYGHKNYYSRTVNIPTIRGKPVCNEIRDSEIKRLLIQLAAKRPGDVFLTFDCCHAGGNTRGGDGAAAAAVRGDIWHGPPPRKGTGTPAVNSGGGKRERSEGASGVAEVRSADFPGFVVLAATSSDQLDYETVSDDGKTHMGALSYAFCQAMDRATRATSYRDLMNEVNAIMAVRVPAQTPQIEGPIDRAVFDGTAIPPLSTIEIVMRDPEQMEDPEDSEPIRLQPRLQVGFLQGMARGSKVALHWRDDDGGASAEVAPFATATVAHVGALDSALDFDPPAQGEMAKEQILRALRGIAGVDGKEGVAPRAAYATLTRQRYPSDPLVVRVTADVPAAEREAVQQAFDHLTSDNWVTAADPNKAQWDLKLQTAAAARSEMPVIRGGSPAYALPKDDHALVIALHGGGFVVPVAAGGRPTPDQIETSIRGEARRRLFASLETPSVGSEIESKYQVEFRFIPVEIETTIQKGVTYLKHIGKDKPQPPNSQTRFAAGDAARLEIRNIGKRPAYVTILNLRGDGTVGPVYPPKEEETDNLIHCKNFAVPPKDRAWQRFDKRDGTPYIFQFKDKSDSGVPYPTRADIYKVFVTKDKADFRLLIDPAARSSRGGAIAGADSPLGRLIQQATAASRGGEALEAPPATGWSVTTVTYEIDPTAGRTKQ